MIKNLLSIGAFLFLSVSVLAQGSLGTSDSEAKKVLDGVSAKFKTYKTVKADFSYKVENNSGKVLGIKKGTVLMKGTKYAVSLPEQEIFCDGKNVWTLDKPAKEVQITLFDNSAGAITPQKLFTNFYEKDFLYKLNGEKKVAGKTIQEIELTPTDKSKPFFKVYLFVDKLTQNITETVVLEKSGNKFTYSVSSLVPNTPMTDAQFVYNKAKYPGVEEIDLRN